MEAPNAETDALIGIRRPEAAQTFVDVDSYKAAKRAMLEYALATATDAGGVRCFKLVEQYKGKVHFWVLNGGPDVSQDYQYILAVDGPASAITVTCVKYLRNIVIGGAIFNKRASLRFSCPNIELRNCTWATPEAVLALPANCVLSIVNPTGRPVVHVMAACSCDVPAKLLRIPRPCPGPGGVSSSRDLMSALLLARVLSAVQ